MPREPQKRYYEYTPGTKCCVNGCAEPVAYEVYLYDYYKSIVGEPKEFFEQDFTCPFLCETHMAENEARADGIRRARGYVRYPYSNKDSAQGYTKYSPVGEAFPLLVDLSKQLIQPRLLESYAEVNEELIRHLSKHPKLLYELDPRRFEELVAAIFRGMGFSVELTPRTRDGGRDVQAVRSDALGTSLYLIECKRYASSRKVGVEPVRSLHGVVQAERATMGILATTSTFTSDAVDFAEPLRYQLSLRDFHALKLWLEGFRRGIPPGYRDREEPRSSPLPHHRTYGSVYGDSADQAESDPGEQKTE